MKRILYPIFLLVLLSQACSPATPAPPPPDTAQEPTLTPAAPSPETEPTLAECRQWLASSRNLETPIACADWDFFREKLLEFGGGAFPVGDGRYYLVWFPGDWDAVAERKVIVSLHGTGGCAEWMLNQWYQTTSHEWALVALQYYDPGTGRYDDDATIYENLQAVLAELEAHCPLAGSDVFYHGFSRGSAQSFPVAIRDRAGARLFAAFIADSGCASLNYPTLRNQADDALSGARFWMWCGENDISSIDPTRTTCQVMAEDMAPYVEAHGGVVDALVRQPDVGHGMFDPCDETATAGCQKPTAQDLGPSLPLLFEYIKSFPYEQPPTLSVPTPTQPTGEASTPPPAAPASAPMLLTVDAAPSGETLRPLLGVDGGPLPANWRSDNPALTEQYHAIGVTMIRTHDLGGPLDMAVMYPDQNADPHDPASYDFEASDQVFAAILEGGFEPYLRLGDSWAVRGQEQRAPTNPDNWVQAAVEVVRRYDELSRQAGVPLRYVEIWNEPNFRQFWDASPREFYDLFAQTAAALKAEFPHLLIGGPGLASSGDSLTPQGEQYTQRFLDYLQRRDAPLDFLSWHVYSSDAAIYAQLAAFYREQLDAHGYTEAESHITEWSTAMQGEDETDAVRNTARGAASMSAAWIALQESGVDVSTFYRGNESGQQGNMGLFYADGRAKPMALAFSLWAQMAAHPQRLNVAQEGGALWVLAGQDESGEVALLIANPNDTPTSWEASFANYAAENATLTLHQVGDPGDEVQVFTLETPAAEIRAYTVQLLVVKP